MIKKLKEKLKKQMEEIEEERKAQYPAKRETSSV